MLRHCDKAEIRGSISKIHDLISCGGTIDDNVSAHGKRNVVILGVTGSGKSTLTNSLAGCQLRRVTREECEGKHLKPNSLCVVGVSEGGPLDAVTDIGHVLGQSQTEVLRPISMTESSLLLWDAPGFDDTNGPEVNISNAVNLSKLLEASKENGITMICVLDAHSIDTGRGSSIQNTISILKKLFGGEEERIQQHFRSILWCVSKASSVDEFPISFVRASVIKFLNGHGLSMEGNEDLIQIYDPLDRNPEGITRVQLISLLSSITPIRASERSFQTPLTDRDMLLVSKIAQVTSEDIADAMREGDFSQVQQLLYTFQSLRVIRNQEVEMNYNKIVEMIKDVVTRWEVVIRSKASDLTSEGRKTLRDHLTLLRNAESLDTLVPDLDVERRLDICSKEIRDEEGREQRRENLELKNVFASCSSYFNKKMHQLAQSDSESFFHCDVQQGIEGLLRQYSTIEEVQQFANAFARANLLLSERASNDKYLYGDQCSLAETIRKYEEAIVLLFTEVVRISKRTVLCQRFDESLQKLETDALQIVQHNFESLCEGEIVVSATPSVIDLFFLFSLFNLIARLPAGELVPNFRCVGNCRKFAERSS